MLTCDAPRLLFNPQPEPGGAEISAAVWSSPVMHHNNYMVAAFAGNSGFWLKRLTEKIACHDLLHTPLCGHLHRWGDGPLRWIQCLLFLDLEREVHQFTDFEYAHYDDIYNRKIVCRGCPTSSRVVG